MPISVPFQVFLDFSKASNSFRVAYIPLGLCWSCWDLGLFPSELLQCTCYRCRLPCPAQKGGGGKFSPSALSLCRYESKSFHRCPFLSPVGNPTSPGSLLLSLLPDQSTETPALRSTYAKGRASFCLAVGSHPVLKPQVQVHLWWVVHWLLGGSHSAVGKCLQREGPCEKGDGGPLVSSRHLGCILCKEGGEALISGFKLCLQ